MIQKIQAWFDRRPRLREMASYLFFGVLTTLINWAVYFSLTALLGADRYPQNSSSRALVLNASIAIAWIAAVSFAFITNRRYVFRSQEKKLGALREFMLFVSARLMSYFLFDMLLFNVMVFGFKIDHKLVKLLMNVLVIVFNYFASKYLIFKQPAAKPAEDASAPQK